MSGLMTRMRAVQRPWAEAATALMLEKLHQPVHTAAWISLSEPLLHLQELTGEPGKGVLLLGSEDTWTRAMMSSDWLTATA